MRAWGRSGPVILTAAFLVLLVVFLRLRPWGQPTQNVTAAEAIAATAAADIPASTEPVVERAELSSRNRQIARGGEIYLNTCKRCHDSMARTEPFPNVISPVINAHALAWHENGPTLWGYVTRYMPFDQPGTLTEDEYYAVLAFLLDINGLLPPDVVLDAGVINRLEFDPFHPSVRLLPSHHDAVGNVRRQ